jgi:uncharacterized protein YndB with AHSA1/START domain
MIEVSQQINAVGRRVGTRSVTVSQTYNATVEEVWDACTNAERIPRWFLPISGELRLHGRYQLEGNAGGTIERCDPPKSFSATWEFGGGVTWIEVRIAADPAGGTRFELEHSGPVDDDRWAEFGPGAVGIGWDMTLLGLASHLASSEEDVRGAGMAWMVSEEGKRFMAESGERWCAAHVESGAPEAEARAAAARTIAAYTGS